MKNIVFIITSFFLIYSAYSQDSQDSSDVFDYGTVENNIYTNSYFKFKINIAPTWVIHSKGKTDAIMSKELNKITQKNPSLKPIFKIKDIKEATLLMANQYKVGIPDEYNAGIIIMAENLAKNPKIDTEEEYLQEVKKGLYITNMGYHIKNISEEKINGCILYKFNAEVPIKSIKVKQTYYCIIIKGFSLSIITAYKTHKQKKELLKMIHSLQISK